jgi:cytochrome c biogenesis protein
MPQEKQSKGFLSELIDFFASVKLALVIIISLAGTSILGTLIPQGEPLGLYYRQYGSIIGKVIQYFQLDDMYHAWWFQWLLLLLTANLVVCSVRRFNTTWKVFKAPSRLITERLFETLPFSEKLSSNRPAAETQAILDGVVGKVSPGLAMVPVDSGRGWYGEKGRYARFGVYLVHASVLIIFLGAIAGSLFGFKGFLELKEGESRGQIVLRGPNTLKDLGFTVRLDKFGISYYDNGMPREYRSDLVFLEQGQEKEKAAVRVNDPFSYKGITFYQSTWDQVPISLRLGLTQGDRKQEMEVEMDQRTPIPDTAFSFQAVRFVSDLSELGPALGIILFKGEEEVDHGWVLAKHPSFHGNRLGDFRFSIQDMKTRFVTGLQVNRDPGIWFIWVGSSLMLLGFIVTFFFSHQQVWIWIRPGRDNRGKPRTEILIGGSAHKNRGAFGLKMNRFTEKIRGSL